MESILMNRSFSDNKYIQPIFPLFYVKNIMPLNYKKISLPPPPCTRIEYGGLSASRRFRRKIRGRGSIVVSIQSPVGIQWSIV